MIYPMVQFPVTSSDPLPRFQGHRVIIDALDVLYAQLTRDVFAIDKFLLTLDIYVLSSVLSLSIKLSYACCMFCRGCPRVMEKHGI